MGQVKAFRDDVSYQNWHRMKIKLLTVIRFGGSLRSKVDQQKDARVSKPKLRRKSSSMEMIHEASKRLRQDAKQTFHEVKDGAKTKVSRWFKKIQGGSAGIPPSFSYSQCLWTFIGVMTTNTILSRLNLFINIESDGDLSLILAPLGELSDYISAKSDCKSVLLQMFPSPITQISFSMNVY